MVKEKYNSGKNWVYSKTRVLLFFESSGREKEKGPPVLTVVNSLWASLFCLSRGPNMLTAGTMSVQLIINLGMGWSPVWGT